MTASGRRELSGRAVAQGRDRRQAEEVRSGSSSTRARETAFENLAHHRNSRRPRGALRTRELAIILFLHELRLGAGNDAVAPTGRGTPWNMTVVIDLDCAGAAVETEQGGQALEMGAAALRSRKAPLQGIPCILQGMIHQCPAAAPVAGR